MKRNSFSFLLPLIGLVVVIFSCKNEDDPFEYLQYVNPFIGTAYTGHTFPNATCPFGMVQPGPQTGNFAWEYCSGYNYEDSLMWGFSQTRLNGTGIPDSGDILMMPFAGQCRENYKSFFDKKTEVAYPGYYAVDLVDNQVKVELTCTPHVAMHRYLFNEENPGLYIDFQSGCVSSEQQYDNRVIYADIKTPDHYTITGEMQVRHWVERRLFFVIKFDKPFISEERKLVKESHRAPSCVYRFETNGKKQSQLLVKVGISTVSIEGAEENLRSELDHWNFDQVKLEAGKKWENYLSRVQIKGTTDQKVSFYTSMYHLMIQPNNIADVDGQYRNSEDSVSISPFGKYYSTFSLWDTYRAEHPFLNLVKPEHNADMVKSMIKHEQQSVHGMLPIWSMMGNENWCMSGYHAVSVLADAIAKGTFSNIDEALSAMISTSTVPYYEGIADYMKLGYIPLDKSGTAASSTLEYAYDDWTIYKTALKAGNKEVAETYLKRALNYRNIYDANIGFARPRISDGTFKKEFDILQTFGEGFIEGNSWNFSFHVPHDVFGMIDLMGGEKSFVEKLDKLFSMHLPEEYYEHNEDITKECLVGGYVHGNEPSHHIPYLYAWTSQPWKTQYWIPEILNKMYRNDINGLGGNDDCGQMSAWYLFSVMGFYPVCPGTDQYVLGTPYFPYLKLKLPNGKTLEIKAPGVNEQKRYVHSLKINGETHSKMYVTHEEILKGGIWEFQMSSSPNKRRGLKTEDKPYSLTKGIN